MTGYSSAIATLRQWLQTGEPVRTEEVRKLLTSIGYSEETAADFRSVWLYYRQGWPRITLMATEPVLPVGYLHSICTKLLTLLLSEATP